MMKSVLLKLLAMASGLTNEPWAGSETPTNAAPALAPGATLMEIPPSTTSTNGVPENVTRRLETRQRRVLIEAVIIEISLNGSKGHSKNQASGPGQDFASGGVLNDTNLLSANSFVALAATNEAGSQPPGFCYLAGRGNDLDSLVTALASNSHVRILQRPRIQTSPAVPASFFVGETRPCPPANYGAGAYNSSSYSSIQQMQRGLSLDVTPLISPDGLLVLDIHQKIDRVAGTVKIANVGDVPVTSSTESQTKVTVRDHETIVLGGLLPPATNRRSSGVPLLKRIPVLGIPFRGASASQARCELVVLVRPTILAGSEPLAQAKR